MSKQTPVHDPQNGRSVRVKPQPKDHIQKPPSPLSQAMPQLGNISPEAAQTLQRTLGNQALGHLTIQRKMTLGPVGDAYEQEADAVAKQVVGQLNTPQTAQRQEEEELQMKPALQRQEDEEELQMKPLKTCK
jgi:hypothetical protein